jgi:hypothetical protein
MDFSINLQAFKGYYNSSEVRKDGTIYRSPLQIVGESILAWCQRMIGAVGITYTIDDCDIVSIL